MKTGEMIRTRGYVTTVEQRITSSRFFRDGVSIKFAPRSGRLVCLRRLVTFGTAQRLRPRRAGAPDIEGADASVPDPRYGPAIAWLVSSHTFPDQVAPELKYAAGPNWPPVEKNRREKRLLIIVTGPLWAVECPPPPYIS